MRLLEHVAFLALITAVTTTVTALIRFHSPRLIIQESVRFFLIIMAGIAVLGTAVYLLEWAFIRPLI